MMDAFKAVFWGFFGVRRKSEYEADGRRLKPQAVIAAGLVAAAVFVLAILGVVNLVTR